MQIGPKSSQYFFPVCILASWHPGILASSRADAAFVDCPRFSASNVRICLDILANFCLASLARV